MGSSAVSPATASPQFFAALDGCLVGELERFRAGLCGAHDTRPSVAQDALLGPGDVEAIVARYDTLFGGTDPRAAMSM